MSAVPQTITGPPLRERADDLAYRQARIDNAINSSLGLSPGMPGYRVGGVAQSNRILNSQRSSGYGGGSGSGYGGGFVPPATGGYNNPNRFRSLNGPPAGGGYGPSRAIPGENYNYPLGAYELL